MLIPSNRSIRLDMSDKAGPQRHIERPKIIHSKINKTRDKDKE